MPVRCIALWNSIVYKYSAGSFHSGYKSLSFITGTFSPSDTESLQFQIPQHWSKWLEPQSTEMRGDLHLREQRGLPPWVQSGTEPAAGLCPGTWTPAPRKATALSQEHTQPAPEGWTPNAELWRECHSSHLTLLTRGVTSFKVSAAQVLSSYYSL